MPGDLHLMPILSQGTSLVTSAIPLAENAFAQSLPDWACPTDYAMQAASRVTDDALPAWGPLQLSQQGVEITRQVHILEDPVKRPRQHLSSPRPCS